MGILSLKVFLCKKTGGGLMEETKGSQNEEKNIYLNSEIKMASRYTIEANKKVYDLLDFDDNEELEMQQEDSFVHQKH